MGQDIRIAVATAADRAAITALHAASLRRLSVNAYGSAVVEAFIAGGTLDAHLIEDRTYFVLRTGGAIAACGGWSARPHAKATLLARAGFAPLPVVRAIFVHPDFARRGLGRRIMVHVEAAIADAGHASALLLASLSGLPLYRSLGYAEAPAVTIALPGGHVLPTVPMHKRLRARPALAA